MPPLSVPNTTTFTLQDVVNVVVPTTNDLVDCFADAVTSKYDPLYDGPPLNNLLNFRNYNATPAVTWVAYSSGISRSFVPCLDTTGQTYYHSGNGFQPSVGDAVRPNSDGSGSLSDGRFKILYNQFLTVVSGIVTDVDSCNNWKNFDSTENEDFSAVATLLSNTFYYHNGAGTYPAVGDLVRGSASSTGSIPNWSSTKTWFRVYSNGNTFELDVNGVCTAVSSITRPYVGISSGFNSNTNKSLSFTVSSNDDVLYFVVSDGSTGLSAGSITDTSGNSWTSTYYGGIKVFKCVVNQTGSRTVTYVNSAGTYYIVGMFSIRDATAGSLSDKVINSSNSTTSLSTSVVASKFNTSYTGLIVNIALGKTNSINNTEVRVPATGTEIGAYQSTNSSGTNTFYFGAWLRDVDGSSIVAPGTQTVTNISGNGSSGLLDITNICLGLW